METERLTVRHQPDIQQRMLSAVVPVLLIAVSYVDPGKWATTVEGGARFGFDMCAIILVLNFAAILCQNLSVSIAVVTGRDLSQICSEEYDKTTCLMLGIQTEISVFLYDLNMILGIAHGLNLIFGLDLLTCVFLTTLDAFIFPLFSALQDNGKIKMVCTCMASSILLSYICGVLINQPEIPFSMGMPRKLSGENAFTLMSLLGAHIMPHNFYLHSSIVQQDLGPRNVSKGALCQDHLFATVFIFSCISLVNYVLMNSAANVFHGTGLDLLTFQDALSLMDQVIRSPTASFAFLLVLFFSSHITALTWNLGRQAVLRDFFRIDIPGWLHHATIRLLAIVPAVYCVWSSGAEGIYQLLLFTQVMIALVLPSSVIPLFRVASSRSIMGVYKVSQFVEFLGLLMFIGMLSVEFIFVVEMIFGNSDWVGNWRWSMGSSAIIPYAILLTTASASLCFMLWLGAAPLKSSNSRPDAQQVRNEDNTQNRVQESYVEKQESDFTERIYQDEHSMQKQEPQLALEKPLKGMILNFPETLVDSASVPQLATIEESCSSNKFPSFDLCQPEESATTKKMVEVSTVSDGNSLDNRTLKTESMDLVEKNVRFEGDSHSQTGKDDEGEIWEHEESSKGVLRSSLSMTSDGPGSFRSLSGKSDDAGSGAGSLSRLAGLGRAARRQLAAVLDEFWGQFYDLHGQATQESKAKKQDMFLGSDPKVDLKSVGMLKADPSVKNFASLGGRGSDSLINSMLYDTPKQQQQQGVQRGVEASYDFQRGSSPSLWSNHRMQLLGACAQNSRNTLDSGERSYSSLRLPPSSDSYSYQPVTVHGYQIASYLSQMAKENNPDYTDGQKESLNPNSPLYSTSNYRDTLGYPSVQNTQNRLSTEMAPAIPNRDVSRNNLLQSETPFYDVPSSGPTEKKYYSMPDISGLLPQSQRDSYLSSRSTLGDSRIGHGPSVNHKMYQTPLYSSPSTRTGTPAFDENSPSKVCRDAFSLQFASSLDARSLWSRQPFEQFGVASKTHGAGSEGVRSERNSVGGEANSAVDWEAKLLKSFRHCILKLLKLEGSDWLFRQNDGADEDLIDRVAARERFLYEAEIKEINRMAVMSELSYSPDRKPNFVPKMDDTEYSRFLTSSVPNCGEGCIWKLDLIISFGVWCIHRILELSLMESRPELWGKYTYVLNRLQGIIDPAFSKPRSPMVPCFCLQIPVARQQRSSPPPPISNGSLPPPARQSRTKSTTAAMLLDMVKDVEIAISCRKGRTGTAAGDVAFPKGKENLASVLKRYKRRLLSKLTAQDGGAAPAAATGMMRKVTVSAAYGGS